MIDPTMIIVIIIMASLVPLVQPNEHHQLPLSENQLTSGMYGNAANWLQHAIHHQNQRNNGNLAGIDCKEDADCEASYPKSQTGQSGIDLRPKCYKAGGYCVGCMAGDDCPPSHFPKPAPVCVTNATLGMQFNKCGQCQPGVEGDKYCFGLHDGLYQPVCADNPANYDNYGRCSDCHDGDNGDAWCLKKHTAGTTSYCYQNQCNQCKAGTSIGDASCKTTFRGDASVCGGYGRNDCTSCTYQHPIYGDAHCGTGRICSVNGGCDWAWV